MPLSKETTKHPESAQFKAQAPYSIIYLAKSEWSITVTTQEIKAKDSQLTKYALRKWIFINISGFCSACLNLQLK